MTTGLFHAHSGLRYLILLLGAAGLLYFALGVATRRVPGKLDRILMSAFAGFVGLQLLLGLALAASGIYYSRLVGHIVLMIAATAVAHVAAAIARRAADPRRANLTRLVGVIATLALIFAGVQAIGRGILQTGVPSVGG